MRRLSVGQLRILSEITGNIAVAWFTAGVISPLFIRPKTLIEFMFFLMLGLSMAVFFSTIALYLVRKVKL